MHTAVFGQFLFQIWMEGYIMEVEDNRIRGGRGMARIILIRTAKKGNSKLEVLGTVYEQTWKGI